MSKILITGASGFIGYHLVNCLIKRGDEIRCLVRKSSNIGLISVLPIEIVYGDVSDADSLEKAVDKVDCVYHLAGLTKEIKPGQFRAVNTEGTKNLVETCLKRSEPPKIIHVSSLAAAGPGSKESPKKETDAPHPVSLYGLSKFEAEKHLIAVSDKIPCTIVRPPFVFGEGDRASLDLFKLVYKTHTHLIPGWINRMFSFVHASDLSNFMIKVEEYGETLDPDSETSGNGIYFISCGEDVKFSVFGKMIGKSLGIEPTIVLPCPPLMVLVAGITCELSKRLTGISGAFDWNKAKESIRGPWICSAEKGRNQLNFKPEKSLQERLNQTAHWYRENSWIR